MIINIAIPFNNDSISEDIEHSNQLKIIKVDVLKKTFSITQVLVLSYGCKAGLATLLADNNIDWLFINNVSFGIKYALNAYSVSCFASKKDKLDEQINEFINFVNNLQEQT